MFYISNFIFIPLILISVTLIIVILMFISALAGYTEHDSSINTSYECGFNPFTPARIQFDVKFYIISVLFVLFDLEIILLFPFTVTISLIGRFGFFCVLFFLFLLTVGFVHEWKTGLFNFITIQHNENL